MPTLKQALLQWFLLALLAPVLAGCRPIPMDGAPPASPALPAEAPVVVGEAERPLVDAALAQVATDLGLEPADLQLAGFEAVDWPDASLGCPQPEMMYAQVVTPGYRLTVTAGDRAFDVHTDAQLPPQAVICLP